MKVKFVGPKPIISHTGIMFDSNKEDKYNYLNITLQLIKALDHEYIPEKKYVYQADTHRLSETEMHDLLERYCPDLDKIISDAEAESVDYVEHKLQVAKESCLIDDLECKTWMKNIEMMRGYMTQRYVNKMVYYCAINSLAEIMKRGHIDYVIAPLFERFAHVFHSVEGILHKGKSPIDTNIEMYEENAQLFVKLDLILK